MGGPGASRSGAGFEDEHPRWPGRRLWSADGLGGRDGLGHGAGHDAARRPGDDAAGDDAGRTDGTQGWWWRLRRSFDGGGRVARDAYAAVGYVVADGRPRRDDAARHGSGRHDGRRHGWHDGGRRRWHGNGNGDEAPRIPDVPLRRHDRGAGQDLPLPGADLGAESQFRVAGAVPLPGRSRRQADPRREEV